MWEEKLGEETGGQRQIQPLKEELLLKPNSYHKGVMQKLSPGAYLRQRSKSQKYSSCLIFSYLSTKIENGG